MAEESIESQLERNRQKVDVDTYDITVRELMGMAKDKELHIAPVYQRKFRWKEEDESRLVESLLLGLPIPSVYVATNTDGSWEVVDGLQRISSILHFMSEEEDDLRLVERGEPLVLKGLETLERFNGHSYADLPSPIQLNLKKRMVRLTALSDKSDPDVRFEVFERLNRGGVELTAQEVRACVHPGKFVNMLDEIADSECLNNLIKLKEGNKNDGTKQEQVLKYFAYLEKREDFSGDVTHFLNEYIKEAKNYSDVSNLKAEFMNICESLSGVIDGPVVRGGVSWTPLNQFEAVVVAAGELKREGIVDLQPQNGWLDDKDLVANSTGGTNTKQKLTARIERAKHLLMGSAPS